MTVRRIKMDEATEAELRQLGESMGMTIHANAKIETVRQKVAAMYDGSEFMLDDAAPAPAQPPTAAAIPDNPPPPPAAVLDDPDDDIVTIFIEKGETKETQAPVWVANNGRGLFILRGCDQPVKRKYIHVLSDAKRIIYHQENGEGDMIPETVLAYPFRVVHDPRKARAA